jgi:replicative DNA helicase
MEMSKQDFAEKILLAKTKTDFYTLKHNPEVMNNAIGAVAAEVYNSKLIFTTGKSLSVEQVISVSRAESQDLADGPLEFVVVDYDQKLDVRTNKETPEWKALQLAVESLEQLAKEINCHVMILAQQGREGEISGSRRSTFPASTVMKFYKDDQDKVLIEVVKNRFGKRGVCIEVGYEPEKSFAREIGKFEKRGERTSSFNFAAAQKPRQIKDD